MWEFLQSTAFTTANDNFILHDMVISQMIDDVYKGIKKGLLCDMNCVKCKKQQKTNDSFFDLRFFKKIFTK